MSPPQLSRRRWRRLNAARPFCAVDVFDISVFLVLRCARTRSLCLRPLHVRAHMTNLSLLGTPRMFWSLCFAPPKHSTPKNSSSLAPKDLSLDTSQARRTEVLRGRLQRAMARGKTLPIRSAFPLRLFEKRCVTCEDRCGDLLGHAAGQWPSRRWRPASPLLHFVRCTHENASHRPTFVCRSSSVSFALLCSANANR